MANDRKQPPRWQLSTASIVFIMTTLGITFAVLRWAVVAKSEGGAALSIVAMVGLGGGVVGWLAAGTTKAFYIGFCVFAAIAFVTYGEWVVIYPER